MNDDFDLDARLRAGAHDFPPAAPPDSERLRDVLTASRRRSRRAQGTVLACAAAVVAGGVGLALRDPGEPEQVAVAGPAEDAPPTTVPALPAVPKEVSEHACGIVGTPMEADGEVYVIYGMGWALSQPNTPDVIISFDGVEIFSPAILRDGPLYSESDPVLIEAPEVSPLPYEAFFLLFNAAAPPEVDGFDAIIVAPLPDGQHEITVTTGGTDHILEFLVDADLGIVTLVATGPPYIGVAPLSTVCDGAPDATVEAPTSVPATTAAPPVSELPATTTTVFAQPDVEAPAATVAPTTSTVPPPTTAPPGDPTLDEAGTTTSLP